ncbi:MAG: TonB-dependent receptor [Halioglobus sp.]
MNQKHIPSQKTLIATAVMALALSSQAVSAQMLEEVIVTAQKKSESLQDTPISIAAFGSDSLENKGINTLVDLQGNVPNLQMTPHPNSATTARVYLRGVGNSDDQITQDPSVAVYLDGVYVARNQGLAMEVGDIERIEVLRGPQGSLYGRNATGGAINFITAPPSLDSVEFKQHLSVGSDSELRAKSMLNVPLTDSLAVKLAYLHAQKDGFVDNPGSGEDRWGDKQRQAWRVDALWQATDTLQVRYGYDNSSIEDTPAFIAAVPLSPQQGDRPDQGSAFVEDLQANDVIASGHNLTLTWDLSDLVTLKSITAYRELENETYQDYHTDALLPTLPIFITTTDSKQDQFTQEFQLLGSALDGAVDYILGAFYFDENGASTDLTRIPIAGTDTVRDVRINNTAYALYGQATWTPEALEQRLHITGGLRWSKDERQADLISVDSLIDGPQISRNAGGGDNAFDDFNPSVVVAYDLTDNMNVYGKLVTGYKTGGYNVRASTVERFEEGFEPEQLLSYELGLKSELWDKRVRLNAAVFFSNYDDIQINVQTDINNPRTTDVFNAGEAEISGLELDVTAMLTESLTLNLAYGYLDAKYTEIIDPTTGVDITDDFRFVSTPEHSYTADLEYVFPAMAIGELTGNISYNWQDEQFSSSTTELGDYITRDYGLLNARLSLSDVTFAGGSLRVAAWGRNLNDEEYYLSHFNAGVNSAMFGEPRSYGIDVVYTY